MDNNNHSDHKVDEITKTVEYHPIFPGNKYEKATKSSLSFPTFGILVFLVVVFFVLKKFIYLKDDKRHSK